MRYPRVGMRTMLNVRVRVRDSLVGTNQFTRVASATATPRLATPGPTRSASGSLTSYFQSDKRPFGSVHVRFQLVWFALSLLLLWFALPWRVRLDGSALINYTHASLRPFRRAWTRAPRRKHLFQCTFSNMYPTACEWPLRAEQRLGAPRLTRSSCARYHCV